MLSWLMFAWINIEQEAMTSQENSYRTEVTLSLPLTENSLEASLQPLRNSLKNVFEAYYTMYSFLDLVFLTTSIDEYVCSLNLCNTRVVQLCFSLLIVPFPVFLSSPALILLKILTLPESGS